MINSSSDIILTVNAGSSSLRIGVFSANKNSPSIAPKRLGKLHVDGIATHAHAHQTIINTEWHDEATSETFENGLDRSAALDHSLSWLEENNIDHVAIIGHRIVHGGQDFIGPTLLDAETFKQLEDLIPLAPLHQPHNLEPYKFFRAKYHNTLQVACFDTSFHQSIDKKQQIFSIPAQYYDHGVRRYGFHGLSYESVMTNLRDNHPKLADRRLILAHLGNGSSLCATHDGRSVATTMGMTALDGLPMGTRSGAIDAGAVLYLMKNAALSIEDTENLLMKKSGLLGLSGGISYDVRILRESQDPQAHFALEVYAQRVAEAAGALAVTLGGIDGLIFTGGIGQNDAQMRQDIMNKLDLFAPFETHTIPDNEEGIIAKHCLNMLDHGT